MMEANLYVFNVGHGAASLLQIEQDNKKYNILIDGGPRSDFKDKLKGLIGEEALDIVILTHIHRDHCNGLVDLFKDWKGEICQLWIPYPIRMLKEIANTKKIANTIEKLKKYCIIQEFEKIKDINERSNSKGEKDSGAWSEELKKLWDTAEKRLKNISEEEINTYRDDIEDEIKIIDPHICSINHIDIRNLNLINDYYKYSKNKNIQKFVFDKAMASYKTLNNMLKNIRKRNSPVPIVQATSGLLLKPFLSSDFQLQISALAPSYSMLHEIERSLIKQDGDSYDPEILYRVCFLAAANVMGVVTKISIDDTTILFPGDSDLQDLDLKDINTDILLCPHHGGHVGNFIEKYEKTINQNNSVKKKIIIISKGKNGGRPSEEWTDFFQKHKKDIEVYCTNTSEKVQKCLGCQPQNWQKENEVLHFSHKNNHWKLESKNNNQRCKFL